MKKYVSWKEVEDYINKLDEKYILANSRGEIPGIYGLPRGGLVLAVMLSHKMCLPLLMAPVEDCIIIDDICDTGESLLHYYKDSSGTKTNKYHITTMYYKENDLVEPEYYVGKKNDEWIVYPWEVE